MGQVVIGDDAESAAEYCQIASVHDEGLVTEGGSNER